MSAGEAKDLKLIIVDKRGKVAVQTARLLPAAEVVAEREHRSVCKKWRVEGGACEVLLYDGLGEGNEWLLQDG